MTQAAPAAVLQDMRRMAEPMPGCAAPTISRRIPALMLTTFLRALALAMLVLAIPVQGFAAVSAGICMAFGHHGDAAAAHDHGTAAEQEHDHGATANHHDDDGVGNKASDDSRCAPCVSCCAATAIASYPPFPLPGEAASPLVQAPTASLDGVAPQLLDRPPLAL